MGSLTAVRAQIALGADLEARNEAGQTPVGLAVSLRETAIAETLNRIRAVQRAARDTAPEIRAPSVKVLRPGQSRPENAPPVRETRTTTTQDGIVVYDSAREEQIAKPVPPRAAFPNTPVWPPAPDYVLSVDGQRVPTNPVAAQFAFDAPADRVNAAPVSPVAAESVALPAPTRKTPKRVDAPAPEQKPAEITVVAPEPVAATQPESSVPAGATTDRPAARPQPMVETVRIPTTTKIAADAPPPPAAEADAVEERGLLNRIGSWFTSSGEAEVSAPAAPAPQSVPVAAPKPVTESTPTEQKDLLDVLANLFQAGDGSRSTPPEAAVDEATPAQIAAASEPTPVRRDLPQLTARETSPSPADARLPDIQAAPGEPASRPSDLPPARAQAAEPELKTASLPVARSLPIEPRKTNVALPQLKAAGATPDKASAALPAANADSREPASADIALPRLAARSTEPVKAARPLPRVEASTIAEPVVAKPASPVNLEQPPKPTMAEATVKPVADTDTASALAWPPAPERLARVGKAVEPQASTRSLPSVETMPSEPIETPRTELAPRLASVDEPVQTTPSLPVVRTSPPVPEPVETPPAIAEVSKPAPSTAELPVIEAIASRPMAAPAGSAEMPAPGPASETGEPLQVAAVETPTLGDTTQEEPSSGLFDRFLGFLTGSPDASPSPAQPVDDAVDVASTTGTEIKAPAPAEVVATVETATSAEPVQYFPGEKRIVSGAWPPAPTEPVEPPPPMPAPVERVEKKIEEPVQTASIENGPAPSRELPPPAWTTAPAVPVETFAFSSSVHLGHRIAEGEAEHLDCLTHIYRHRRNRIRACVVDVKWPREIRPDFVSNSIIYVGQKALVIYQDGVAAAMYALFRTEAYDRIASHFASQYGPSVEYRREKVQLMAGGREVNEISVWRGNDPASGLAMEMEMRRFDDVRDLFGDPYHGMIEIRFAESRRVFQFVQPLDLMTNR